jgi:hypothetical protein
MKGMALATKAMAEKTQIVINYLRINNKPTFFMKTISNHDKKSHYMDCFVNLNQVSEDKE